MTKINFAYHAWTDCIRSCTSNTLENPGYQKTVEGGGFGCPYGAQREHHQTDEDDGSATKYVRERDPPDIGTAKHQDVDLSRYLVSSSEDRDDEDRLTNGNQVAEVCLGHWWVKVRGEKGQRAGQGSGCNVGYETVDRGGEKGRSLPPETPIQWVGRAS